jgi:bacterial/archaeal transporter family protein
MMSQPIAYALVAMVCYGVCDFIYKQAATAGIRANHFLMVQAWFFCSLVILYALATGTIVLDPAALWGMLAGVLAFVGLYYFIRSLAAGAVSTNASIFRLNFIVTVALVVVLLGEPLTLRKVLGLAFALLATWLL